MSTKPAAGVMHTRPGGEIQPEGSGSGIRNRGIVRIRVRVRVRGQRGSPPQAVTGLREITGRDTVFSYQEILNIR